jgi:hypothetical protein
MEAQGSIDVAREAIEIIDSLEPWELAALSDSI